MRQVLEFSETYEAENEQELPIQLRTPSKQLTQRTMRTKRPSSWPGRAGPSQIECWNVETLLTDHADGRQQAIRT